MAFWPLILLIHFLLGNSQISADSIIKITAPEVIVYAGKSSVIHIYVAVKKGYHIQANKVNDEFMIPTTLETNTETKIITDKQIFPAGKKFKLQGTDDYLSVYDGIFKIIIPFKTYKKIQKGEYSISAKLHYQACDNRTCFFPKIIEFSIPITVK